jgi:SAM-dependent methyltransferase
VTTERGWRTRPTLADAMNATRAKPDGSPQAQRESLRLDVLESYGRAAAVAGAVAVGSRPVSCGPHSGLGCGSPLALAELTAGEWVLDLGSGAGFDCLAAGVEVGAAGRVVGVDMTPEMVRLACRHAAEAGVSNVRFLQAQIERLPFPDAIFDVVISNCVVNLSLDKEGVLSEACRVLKPGGRLAVADIVALRPLDPDMFGTVAHDMGCIAGALPLNTLPRMLRDSGFVSERIVVADRSPSLLEEWAPGRNLGRYLAAASITAVKPTSN